MVAIEALKQKPGGTRDERRIFYYDLLFYRYVQKLSQEEVASQIGVSPRQFAREQDHAIDLLAMTLTEQHPELTSIWNHAEKFEPAADKTGSELQWLDKNSSGQAASFAADFEIVLSLVAPLAEQNKVIIDSSFDARIPGLAIHPVMFRQALLSVINVAIHQAGRNKIRVDAQELEQSVRITVQAERVSTTPDPNANPEDQASLEMARQLLQMNQGNLDVELSASCFTAVFHLLPFQSHVVLLVDDNQDFHQLVQRFAYGTRYQIISTRDPGQAINLAIKHGAQLILLDVMMPEIDGWQVLGQLRRNPQTSQIPVIICTIVAQEQLAYSLGASAFLRKPLTRELLIETLDRLSATGAQGSG